MASLLDFRLWEFIQVSAYFQPKMRVLEIGGGSGYQAKLISSAGASVESLDVAAPVGDGRAYFEVQIYDGKELPFPDAHFDIVYSSNVLEHVPDLIKMLEEIGRTMKPTGIAIHVLPTPSWRIGTSLTYYYHIFRRLRAKLTKDRQDRHAVGVGVRSTLTRKILCRAFMDGPHGEYPSAISELWYFSARRWSRLFTKYGFSVEESKPCGLFYTGYTIFPLMSLDVRHKLAQIFGSSTRVYILKKVQ